MMRTSIVHGSSLGNPDTLIETGTWAKVGDSAIFTPTPGTAKKYDFGLGYVVPITDNYPPVRLKINVSGNTWTADIPKFTDYDVKLTTVMTKK
jgi:hypothetical protein